MIELSVDKLYQWDQGVVVSGFTGDAVQFANQGDSQAVTIRLDGEKRKRIPDRYLTSGKAVKVYDVTVSENSDVTETHSVTIFPVAAKPKPKNYVPTEAEKAFSLVENLVNKAKEAAKESENHARDAGDRAGEAAYHAARAEAAATRAENAADELQPLVVETEGDTFAASHSASDIFAAAAAGKDVILKWVWDDADPVYIPLATATAQAAVFVEYSKDTETIYTVDTDGVIDSTTLPLSSLAVLDDTKNGAKNTWSAKKISESLDSKASIDNETVGKDAWSSKTIVDRLCLPIHESGTVVQCEPVEGYPMAVTVDEASVPCEITLCGKNIYDPIKYPLVDGYYINKGSGAEAGLGSHNEYCATRTYIPVAHLRGKKINLNHIPNGNYPGMAFYDADKVRTDPSLNGKGNNQTVPDEAVYMKFCTYQDQKESVQIELGSVATSYEPYSGTSIAVENSEVEVTARGGVNTIYALAEDAPVNIEVVGRADPIAIIKNLTNAFLSLGTNM